MIRNSIIALVVLLIIVVIGAVVWKVVGGSWFSHTNESETPPVATTTPEQPAENIFASSTLGYSVHYPVGYTLNENYAYDQFGPKKLIHGVSFTIPATMATGTNLSPDTRVSIEQLPNAKNCTGDIYILANVKPQSVMDGVVEYSLASSTGAGAGNRYEEIVYAIKNSKPCTAVRYLIHYGVIENYPAGVVREFDRASLLNDLDKIRQSLQLSQANPAGMP